MKIKKKTKDLMFVISIGMLATLVIIGLIYGAWNLKRVVNYKISYQSMVQTTVCTMVKPEYIRDGECAK